MALCGKNLSLDAVTDKIAEIESKITEKLDAVASDLKAELDAKLPELEKELDNLAEKLPDEPFESFQEEFDKFINLTLDPLKSSEAAEKLNDLKGKFTDALDKVGTDIDTLISTATSELASGASPSVADVEKEETGENTDTVIITEVYKSITQVQGMKEGTNFFGGVGYTTSSDGDDTIVTTRQVYKKIKVIYTVEQTTSPNLDPITGFELPSFSDLGLPSLSFPTLPNLDFSEVPELSPESLAAGQAKMKDAICNMPNLEVNTGASGTQEFEQKENGADSIILDKTPTSIVSVQGREEGNNFFGNIQYSQDGKNIFLNKFYAEIKVVYNAAVVKQKAKESLIPQEAGEEETPSAEPEITTKQKEALNVLKSFKIDADALLKRTESIQEHIKANVPNTIEINGEISKSFIEKCKEKEETIKMEIVDRTGTFDPQEKKEILENKVVQKLNEAEDETGVQPSKTAPVSDKDLNNLKKLVDNHVEKMKIMFSQMTLINRNLRKKNTPQTFDYTKTDGTKVKVTLDTNIGFLDDPSFARRLQVKGQNLRNTQIANWLSSGKMRRKNRFSKHFRLNYKLIDKNLTTNPNATEDVRKFYEENIAKETDIYSLQQLADFRTNFEVLCNINDGEDVFEFDKPEGLNPVRIREDNVTGGLVFMSGGRQSRTVD